MSIFILSFSYFHLNIQVGYLSESSRKKISMIITCANIWHSMYTYSRSFLVFIVLDEICRKTTTITLMIFVANASRVKIRNDRRKNNNISPFIISVRAFHDDKETYWELQIVIQRLSTCLRICTHWATDSRVLIQRNHVIIYDMMLGVSIWGDSTTYK